MESDNAMRITVVPTREKVVVNGTEFRVFRGKTNSGIDIELMGLFRITDPVKRLEFVDSVCVVGVKDPPPLPLLKTPDMVTGA